MSGTINTGSGTSDGDGAAEAAAPFVARVFAADDPLAAPSRHSLDGIDRVVVQRDDRPTATRRARELVLGCPDPRMSERHAELVWLANAWHARDLHSKNGIRIDGTTVTRRALAPGELLECGRTWFVLGAPAAREPAPDRVADPDRLDSLDPAMVAALTALDRVAATGVGVVVVGETGTGKEVVARELHARSGRTGAFVALDCAALPRDLVEGTLFGHVRGAFSGAVADQLGVLRAADRGTLLVDELADLSPTAQGALLRALQQREVVPLGTTRPVPVDFRVVVASQLPLATLVGDGRLRPDLAHRLAGATIAVPPLRERRVDLGLLIAALIRRMPSAARPARFAPGAVRALHDHGWPGNVRELEKCLELAVLAASGGTVERAHLTLEATDGAAPTALSAADAARRAELVAALTTHRGNISAVARALGKDRVQVRRWLDRFALDPARFRD